MYEKYEHNPPSTDLEPAQPGWCPLGSFDYQSYEYEAPCITTAEQFTELVANLDVFSADARADFTRCTGNRFDPQPADRPVFVYITRLDEEPTSDIFETMSELITASYDVPEKVTLSKSEEDKLRAEARKIPKEKIEGDTITELNKIAWAYSRCSDPADELAQIPPLEQRLVELDAKQIDFELHDSYWAEYTKTGSAGRSSISNKSPWFYERSESKMNVTTVLEDNRRQLQSFKGDDYIMINDLREKDRPSRLTTCVNGDTLTGFQVFYGEYDEIAGSAHGDLSTECTNYLINEEIWKVIFYGSSDGKQYIVGMEMVLQPFRDVAFPGTTISAGTVGQPGQKKRTVQVPNNKGSGNDYIYHFFGFVTSSSRGVISNVSVITYNPEELFRSRYDFPALTGAARSKAADYRQASELVAGILVNRALTKLPQAVASEAGEIAQSLSQTHTDDEVEANRGAIVACVIGSILLFIIILLCIFMCVKGRSMMMGSGYNTAGNNSMRSNNSSMQQP